MRYVFLKNVGPYKKGEIYKVYKKDAEKLKYDYACVSFTRFNQVWNKFRNNNPEITFEEVVEMYCKEIAKIKLKEKMIWI